MGSAALATVANAADCPKPGEIFSSLRSSVEGASGVSEALARVKLVNPRAAAVLSVSLQSSKGRFDPRILIFTDCFALTFSLTSKSLEGGLLDVAATEPLPKVGIRPGTVGEILFEFAPSPRGLTWHLNRWDPKTGQDSLRCVRCHVDNSVTKGPLGATAVSPDGNPLEAVVSPYFDSLSQMSSSASWASYCVEEGTRYGAQRPSDLDRLHHCLCTEPRMSDADCKARAAELENPWVIPGSEACARLEATLRLGPRQEWRYDPRSRSGALFRPKPCYFGR